MIYKRQYDFLTQTPFYLVLDFLFKREQNERKELSKSHSLSKIHLTRFFFVWFWRVKRSSTQQSNIKTLYKLNNNFTDLFLCVDFQIFQSKAIETNVFRMERGIQGMTDAHGLCLQDFVTGGTNNGTNNDHLHNHHNLHDSVSSAVSVSSAITGLMSSGNNSLNHLSHDTTNHHSHHHHNLSNTPALHEPLEKLKCKF